MEWQYSGDLSRVVVKKIDSPNEVAKHLYYCFYISNKLSEDDYEDLQEDYWDNIYYKYFIAKRLFENDKYDAAISYINHSPNILYIRLLTEYSNNEMVASHKQKLMDLGIQPVMEGICAYSIGMFDFAVHCLEIAIHSLSNSTYVPSRSFDQHAYSYDYIIRDYIPFLEYRCAGAYFYLGQYEKAEKMLKECIPYGVVIEDNSSIRDMITSHTIGRTAMHNYTLQDVDIVCISDVITEFSEPTNYEIQGTDKIAKFDAVFIFASILLIFTGFLATTIYFSVCRNNRHQ